LQSALQHERADHVPVLAQEVRELLAVEPGETVVDGTFGAGGHAELLAADLAGRGRLIAIDKDASARPYFERLERRIGVQARFLRGDFAVVLGQLADNGVEADAVLLDLGVSSMQIDRPERGFSYAADAPLDMRMDASANRSAREVVNEASERELAETFRRYGEERFARQIARAIVRRRAERQRRAEPERTGRGRPELRRVVAERDDCRAPRPGANGPQHPARVGIGEHHHDDRLWMLCQEALQLPRLADVDTPPGELVKRGLCPCRLHRVLRDDDHRPGSRVSAHVALGTVAATKRRTSLMGIASARSPAIIVLIPTT